MASPRKLADTAANAASSTAAATPKNTLPKAGVRNALHPGRPPRLLAGNVVAMEDGYQMDVLSGRRTRDEVKLCLYSFARAVTGCEL